MTKKPPRLSHDLLAGKSLGQLIGDGLQEFADALATDPASIAREFTGHTISLELQRTPYTPQLVKATRQLLGASQTVFAKFLGVSPQAVHAWEQGVNIPKDSAARFMEEIRAKPDYFRERIRSLAVKRKNALAPP